MTFIPNQDYFIKHAIDVIFATYGDVVSVEAKNKDLLKFGRNKLVDTVKSTLMSMPVGIDNETYVSTNIITKISSSNATDSNIVTIEGHTISGGVFTFLSQQATLNGQSIVTLSTPLARVSRVVNDGSTDLVGAIYVYQTDTVTAGVPDTNIKVHLIVEVGLNNSEKASTTLSNTDYLILTEFYCDCLEKTSTYGTVHLEVREAGKTFINKVDISTSDTSRGLHEFHPFLIVPKNADLRIRITSSAVNKDFSGGFEGVLLSVI